MFNNVTGCNNFLIKIILIIPLSRADLIKIRSRALTMYYRSLAVSRRWRYDAIDIDKPYGSCSSLKTRQGTRGNFSTFVEAHGCLSNDPLSDPDKRRRRYRGLNILCARGPENNRVDPK